MPLYMRQDGVAGVSPPTVMTTTTTTTVVVGIISKS